MNGRDSEQVGKVFLVVGGKRNVLSAMACSRRREQRNMP